MFFSIFFGLLFFSSTAVAEGDGSNVSALLGLLPTLGFLAIWYLLVLRPKVVEERKHKALLESLAPGNKILLASGIYGIVSAVKTDKLITVEIAKNVIVEVSTDFIESSS